MWDGIERHIGSATGTPFTIKQYQSVGGGSINQSYCLAGESRQFFLKTNTAIKVAMFEAEALGLNEMADTGAIAVPRAICWGVDNQHSYIVLDWLDLGRNQSNWTSMGKSLARLHQHTTAQGFGWHQNNTIGDTPQMNSWSQDWSAFYRNSRLKYQFKLANKKGGHFAEQDRLLNSIPDILGTHLPSPSLVHGDLWSGNAAFTISGEPVIFDPAPYYGDREVDIAMTELFGGFPQAFYQGYQSVFPLEDGYEVRKILYNLYHVLNHFNLFGGGYKSQAQQMIRRLLNAI